MQFRLFSFALIVLNCMEYSNCQAPSHRWRRNKRGNPEVKTRRASSGITGLRTLRVRMCVPERETLPGINKDHLHFVKMCLYARSWSTREQAEIPDQARVKQTYESQTNAGFFLIILDFDAAQCEQNCSLNAMCVVADSESSALNT